VNPAPSTWREDYHAVLEALGLGAPSPSSQGPRNGGSCPVIAVVGAGGKSTTVFALAALLHEGGARVVVTTTTKMGVDQSGGLLTVGADLDGVRGAVTAQGRCRIAVQPDPSSPKVVGPDPAWLDELARSGIVDAIVIEADGARRRNVKAPAHYEPVLPGRCTHVVSVLSAQALDRVIEDQGHRPLRIAAAIGCSPYDRLTPERAAVLLCSDAGGRKDVGARSWCGVVTQVDAATKDAAARTLDAVRSRGHRGVSVHVDPTTRGLVRRSDDSLHTGTT
jgi:probable selenium-dependent hydroxylase accessory protein YqeC